MSTQYLIRQNEAQVPHYEAADMAQGLCAALASFLFPLLVELDGCLDKRLVRTFAQTIAVILTFRDRVNGLLLSELGGYLLPPGQAPAGTKRLSNLLHSLKWSASIITHFLWAQASKQLEDWVQAGQDALVIWDESAWEKPESIQADWLGSVRSSKAARLTHVKKGFYTPPRGPICVPGMHWLAILLLGRSPQQGPPHLAAQRWWSNRGPQASWKRDEEGKLLIQLASSWGRQVLHIFDRGFASSFWLGLLLAFALRFVLRWRHQYHLVDAQGNKRAAWKIARGKRGWEERTVWDSRRHLWLKASVLALPVCHPEYPQTPLWLLIARSQGRAPWYLLTAEPVTTAEQAWQIMVAYSRRWSIETTWRYDQSELAFQSPRLWQWEPCEKLLLLATLAYAFLLTLLEPLYDRLRCWLLRTYCHRTGRRCRQSKAPPSRLRCALSRLWQDWPPNFALLGSARTHIYVTIVN